MSQIDVAGLSPELSRVLERLDGVSKSGDGWAAKCPAHDDSNASLTVSAGTNGMAAVIVTCHAGCETDAIVAALKLQWRDLFLGTYRPPKSTAAKVDGKWRRLAHAGQESLPELASQEWADHLGVSLDALVALGLGRLDDGWWSFPLFDAERQIVGVAKRHSNGDKQCRGARGLFLKRGRLGSTVFVTEGPTDAAAVLTIDPAASVVGRYSANHETTQLARIVRGAHVVLIADNDGSGRRGAAHARTACDRTARSVVVLTPRRHKDIREAVLDGLTAEHLHALVDLQRAAGGAP